MGTEELTIGLPAPKPLRLAETALFLDLDGTLAPIAARPQDVRPDARRTRLLKRLAKGLDGRLAVVSGRTVADIDRILDGCVTCIAAVHGLVWRGPDGVLHESRPHEALPEATAQFRAFASRDSGILVEEKGLSVALHYRLARAHAQPARLCAEAIARETGLVLQHGDMVEELRTPGPTKGDSVARFLRLPVFDGASPVFVGDDVTDEHGFEAVQAHGGLGVLVAATRTTAARCRLRGVEEALVWLEAAS